MKLSNIEKEILKAIQKNTPFAWEDVLKAYTITESFDATIRTLFNSVKYAERVDIMATYQCANSIRSLINP